MIEIWFYVLVCTGFYWCLPEHNNWQVYNTYSTLEECESKGSLAAKNNGSMGEKWVAICLKGVRVN